MTEQEYVINYIAIAPGRPTTQDAIERFVELWQYRILHIIRQYYDREDEVEDIYQYILESWIKQDMISSYDPTIANFSTYVYAYVKQYTLNFRYKFYRDMKRKVSLDNIEIEVDGPEPKLSLDTIIPSLNTDQYWLFMSIMRQVHQNDKKNINELASIKGLSVRAINYQLSKLRSFLVDSGAVQTDTTGYAVWTDSLP